MYIILLVKIDDVLLGYIFLLIKIAVREVFYFDSFYKSEVKWQYAETGGNFFAGFGQHLTERRTEEKSF